MKNKQIISIIVVLVLLMGGYVAYRYNSRAALLAQNGSDTSANPLVNGQTMDPADSQNPAMPLKSAWEVFQQYLGYIKTYDIEKVKTVVSANVLEFNPTCPMRQVSPGLSCNELMDLSYGSGIKLKKADYVNSFEDSKQIVLSTNLSQEKSEVPDSENYRKSFLFFTKAQNGEPQFLASYSVLTTFVYKDFKGTSAEAKKARVTKSFLDVDKDGLLDRYESCTDKGASPYNDRCTTTSASKRDSLGDGVWDGVRIFFGHK